MKKFAVRMPSVVTTSRIRATPKLPLLYAKRSFNSFTVFFVVRRIGSYNYLIYKCKRIFVKPSVSVSKSDTFQMARALTAPTPSLFNGESREDGSAYASHT